MRVPLSYAALFVLALAMSPVHAGIFGWGNNENAQLGDGTFIDRISPSSAAKGGALAGKTAVAISTGWYHSVALSSDGRVFTWGNNAFGQLGNGSTSTGFWSPAPVAATASGALAGRSVTAVAAGGFHTVARASDGRVFAWGYNTSGQLGNGKIATAAPYGEERPTEVNMSGALAGRTVTAVAAGWMHSVVLTSDGKLFAWGENFAGQLGDGTTTNRATPVAVNMNGVLAGKTVIAIAAAGLHTIAMTSDRKLFAWGSNVHGQLGAGALAGRLAIAIAAGDYHTLLLATDADFGTRAPVLTAPVNPTLTNSPVSVIFTLPEAALVGSVRLSFANESNAQTLTLATSQEGAGMHNFRFDPTDPTSSPEIASGAAIPDGTYVVNLSYQDVRGNPPAFAVSRNVTVNTTLPMPAFVAAKGANVNGQATGSVYAGFATPQTGAFAGFTQVGKTRSPQSFHPLEH